MSKISVKFGEKIKSFLQNRGLTFRAASLKSGISAAYWKDMADGRVPSEAVIDKIAESFEDLDVNELRIAAGLLPKPGEFDAVRAVEFALRGNAELPDEGKRQIIEFVKKIQRKYSKE